MNIDEIMARLNPTVRDKVIKASESTNEKQALPSVGLTKTLGGGIGYGRQTSIWGNRSAGKTMLCLQAVSMAQIDGRGCAWIDAEKNYDKNWAERLGVDNSQLFLSTVTSIADVADAVSDMIRSGVEFVVIDSISALLPGSFYSDKDEMKAFENTGQIGQFSKEIGSASKMLNATNHNAAIVMISQVRTNLGGYHASLKPMGGNTIDHMNSTSIRLWSGNGAEDRIEDTLSDGDYSYKTQVGRKIKWTIDKNRGPGMGAEGQYNLYYQGDFVGIDTYGELVQLGNLMGKVKKSGTWYYIYDDKFQGIPAASKYLRNNPAIFEKLRSDVIG